MNKVNKVLIKFTRQNLPYSTGDVAGFDKKDADKFVKKGAAVYYNKKVKKPKVNKKMEKPKVNKKVSIDQLEYKGGGYYKLPNGESVRGKDNALKKLKELNS